MILKTKIAGGIMEIPTALIQPDPEQPRKEFTPEEIKNLAESIKSEGLLHPITVRRDPATPGSYIIIAGERRWRAHCLADLQTVRCIVSLKHDDDRRRYRAQALENMGRAQMTLREESTAVARLSELGDSDEVIASALGLSKTRVRNFIRLSKLSPISWQLIDSGAIFPTFAEAVVASARTPRRNSFY